VILEGKWHDLETKGYVVAGSFLDEPVLSILRTHYEAGPRPSAYFLGLKPLAPRAEAILEASLRPLMEEIRERTTLSVDRLLKGYYFATAFVKYGWHQDFDVLAQDWVNYLNCYIPIVKPRRDKSNLSVVPFDTLEREAPDAYRRLRGAFGSKLNRMPGTRAYRVVDIRDRSECVLDVDVDGLAMTPHLAGGDLMLLRADVIHRTQDADTQRVAISLRLVDSRSRLRRDGLMSCGLLVKRQQRESRMLMRCFDAVGRDEVTMDEFVRFTKSHEAVATALNI
jgi:hypothetical protein